MDWEKSLSCSWADIGFTGGDTVEPSLGWQRDCTGGVVSAIRRVGQQVLLTGLVLFASIHLALMSTIS
jgi:hypothetical protein